MGGGHRSQQGRQCVGSVAGRRTRAVVARRRKTPHTQPSPREAEGGINDLGARRQEQDRDTMAALLRLGRDPFRIQARPLLRPRPPGTGSVRDRPRAGAAGPRRVVRRDPGRVPRALRGCRLDHVGEVPPGAGRRPRARVGGGLPRAVLLRPTETIAGSGDGCQLRTQ